MWRYSFMPQRPYSRPFFSSNKKENKIPGGFAWPYTPPPWALGFATSRRGEAAGTQQILFFIYFYFLKE
jgi:hypothetical protein